MLVGVGVRVGVGLGVLVAVGLGVLVAVGLGVLVAVGSGVLVGVGVKVGAGDGEITSKETLSLLEQVTQPEQSITPQKGFPVHFPGSSGESTCK